MAAVTRLGEGGYGVRRYGSFAGKSQARPISKVTRLGESGYGVRRYAAFTAKTVATATKAVGSTRKRLHREYIYEAVEERAAQLGPRKRKQLISAAEIARRAMEAAEFAESARVEAHLAAMARALETAMRAEKLAAITADSKLAIEYAQMALRQIEDDEEEEAIALLLLH